MHCILYFESTKYKKYNFHPDNRHSKRVESWFKVVKITPDSSTSTKYSSNLPEYCCHIYDATWRFRKIYSDTNYTFLFVYCCTVYEYLDLTPKCDVLGMYNVHCTCIMEFATSRTLSAVRNTTTSDKSKRTPSITIGSTFFNVHNLYVIWLQCAGRRLNDSFRGIQLLE